MNLEQLIAAKTQLNQIDATWGFWVSMGFLVFGLVGFIICVVVYRRDSWDDALSGLGMVIFGVVCLFAIFGALQNFYNYRTAELQARNIISQYHMLEIHQSAK